MQLKERLYRIDDQFLSTPEKPILRRDYIDGAGQFTMRGNSIAVVPGAEAPRLPDSAIAAESACMEHPE
jgi:hypothetical protein